VAPTVDGGYVVSAGYGFLFLDGSARVVDWLSRRPDAAMSG